MKSRLPIKRKGPKKIVGTRKTRMKTVTICSSAAFFERVIEVSGLLKSLGFKVLVPFGASEMERNGDFNVGKYKTWFADASAYEKKTFLIKNHFDKIVKGDAVLVLNYEKNGKPGYIGGCVLMEMAIGLHFKKPIYILNPIQEDVSYKEEILGMQPIFMDGDIANIGKIKGKLG